MPKNKNKVKSENHSTSLSKTGNLFGQSGVFDLYNKDVNPEVIEYLENVKTEAIRTIAMPQGVHINDDRINNLDGGSNSTFYDEVPLLPKAVRNFLLHKQNILQWYKTNRYDDDDQGNRPGLEYSTAIDPEVEEPVSVEENENLYENVNKLLLLNLKSYYSKKYSENSFWNTVLRKIFNELEFTEGSLLLEMKKNENTQGLELDEEWAIDFFKYLEINLKYGKLLVLKNPQDLLNILENYQHQAIPTSFYDWCIYIDTHPQINKDVRNANICIPSLEMKLNLISHIVVNHKHKDFSQWVEYILLTLPPYLNSKEISILRDLAKISNIYVKNDLLDQSLTLRAKLTIDIIVSNSSNINTKKTLARANDTMKIDIILAELVLCVVGEVYGQKDLIPWS
ncbi:uncharacterized protein SCODWIG_01672 [Saccharomycodes ludwigii]|uniref:Uncharacterized protein n=1 Tax=Saccharomycodes ludwigii TaxID=36035 RepID=A0A376B5J6_9ASCO|nr:uncharacterized protein SCODWIG_01672 [Saccharomycodes ludwigii]